jgi:predicted transposase/invertase (TIGR01784 family)
VIQRLNFGKKNTMGVIEQLAEIKHQEGREEGREKGRKEGRKEGREEGKAEVVRSLLAKTEFSAEKIAEIAGVAVSFVSKIRKGQSAK